MKVKISYMKQGKAVAHIKEKDAMAAVRRAINSWYYSQ